MERSTERRGSIGRVERSIALGLLVLGLAAGFTTGRIVTAPSGGTDGALPEVTKADYARAESFLGWNAARLVDGMSVVNGAEGVITANWIKPLVPGMKGDSTANHDDRFWYVVQRAGKKEFVFVDPAEGIQRPAFDPDSVMAGLNLKPPLGDTTWAKADSLPFSTFRYGSRDTAGITIVDLNTIHFLTIQPTPLRWTCAAAAAKCTALATALRPDRVRAPPLNQDTFAYIRDNNLWLANSSDTVGMKATVDGADKRGYGAVPEECCAAVTGGRWTDGVPPQGPLPLEAPYLAWSPDGTKIVTHLYDESGVKNLYLLETAEGRPILHAYSYALPGDSLDSLPRYKFFVYHRDNDALVEIRADWMVDGFSAETFPVRWSGSDSLFFTRHTPDYKKVELLVADASTGETRVVVTETSQTFVSLSSLFPFLPPNWRILEQGREVIWFSERSGWGHLYRYSVADGTLLNPITSGEWLVLEVKRVDEAEGWVYFTGLGREPDRDPYLALLYRARIDGSEIQLLTPEGSEGPTNHAVQISPSGSFILDTYSRRDLPGRTVVRSTDDGSIMMEVEQMNISRLTAKGWKVPEHFTVKARDDETELHGFLHFPSYFDSTDTTRKYPVIDFIYPGPQIGPILSRSFSVQPFGDPNAMAELGFIVLAMDARGTPQRSKAFDDADYASLASYAMADHITALEQLKSRIPQIDLERIGIYGHSGGGAATAAALIEYGDTFDVGVAGAGNHDDRSYYFAWANKYDGGDMGGEWDRLVRGKKLTGKLLITYGTMDDNVHPNNSLRLIDALIRNNEDFDVLVLPNRDHEYMSEPYAIRKGWDYFVTHLLGAEPPWEYEIKPPPR